MPLAFGSGSCLNYSTDHQAYMSMTSLRTLAFHKPYGVLPCFTDLNGWPTLADFIDLPGVYAAGRLDQDSEGLMILTLHAPLAHRITDPNHKLPKVYLAQVEREPSKDAVDELQKGVVLSGKRTRPADVRLLAEQSQLPVTSIAAGV